jgi:hypothetical protein
VIGQNLPPVLPKLVHQPQVLRSDQTPRHYPRVGDNVLISTVRRVNLAPYKAYAVLERVLMYVG